MWATAPCCRLVHAPAARMMHRMQSRVRPWSLRCIIAFQNKLFECPAFLQRCRNSLPTKVGITMEALRVVLLPTTESHLLCPARGRIQQLSFQITIFSRSNSNLAACSGHSLEPYGASTCLWPLEAFNHQGTSNMNRSRLDCTVCSYRLARLPAVRDGCAALSFWLSKLRRHLQRLHHVSPVVHDHRSKWMANG